jgi:hypothetical protein
MPNPAPTPVSILSRIRKLSAMTIANSCSESEANFTMQKLAEFMAEHSPSESELQASALQCAIDELITMDSHHSDWSGIAVVASRHWGCRCWGTSRTEDLLGLGFSQQLYTVKFFGLPNDAAAAQALTAMCFMAVQTEAAAFAQQPAQQPTPLRTKRPNAKANAARATTVRSFRCGMADRLRERIKQLSSLRPELTTGQGLVVLKDQLVTREFAKLGMRLRRHNSTHAIVDSSAYAVGQARANGIGLGQSNTIRSSPLAISG